MDSNSIIIQKVAEKDPKAAEDLKGWSHFYQLDKVYKVYLRYILS